MFILFDDLFLLTNKISYYIKINRPKNSHSKIYYYKVIIGTILTCLNFMFKIDILTFQYKLKICFA